MNIELQNEVRVLKGSNKGLVGYVRSINKHINEVKICCWNGIKIHEPISNLEKLRENAFIPIQKE